jgi:hypothetical protein
MTLPGATEGRSRRDIAEGQHFGFQGDPEFFGHEGAAVFDPFQASGISP